MRRSLWLLVALVVVQLFLLSAQLSEGDGAESGVLSRWLLAIVAPFGSGVDGLADGVEAIGERLATRSRLLVENERLRRENLELRREGLRQRKLARELERLTRAADYAGAWEGRLKTADVVYVDHTSWLQTALLAVGEGGARRNQPVVTAEGLLGRVVTVQGPYAKVQLITDRAASVGVMVDRTRRQGLVRGAGRGALALDFIPLQADLLPGDRLVTAGIDGVYPRGLPVGTVTAVTPGDDLFFRVEVAPAVDFVRLDQAYVLDLTPVPEAAKRPGVEGAP